MTMSTRTEEVVILKNKENGFVKENEAVYNNNKNEEVKNSNAPYSVDTKGLLPSEIGTDYNFKRKIVWFNAIGFLILHIMAFIGLYLTFTSCNWLTIGWMLILMAGTGQGVTMGAHRMWSHKTFKARFIVRLVLIILQTIAGQNCLYIWARDHRLHHKYSDTDADPHNSNRGFFFSHMGWLMTRKHPAVISKGKTIDMSDLEADPLVMIQKEYYKSLYLIFAIAIPVAVPVYLWDESYINAFFSAYMLRYITTLHVTWLVNSAAHMFGTKPFDKNMRPVESYLVSLLSIGEGWHNYHHAFPWDYRASEFGARFNGTTMLIDLLAYVGLIYDLRAAPEYMVKHRALKAGDGSHSLYGPMKEVMDNAMVKKESQKKVTEAKTPSETVNEKNEAQNEIKSKEDLSLVDKQPVSNGNLKNEDTLIKRTIKPKQIIKK